MSSSALLTTASLLGLTTSLYASGIHFSASHLTIPLLLPLPTQQSLPAFKTLYNRGAQLLVPLTLLSVLSSATASYLSPSTPLNPLRNPRGVSARLGYAIAALSTVSALVWTAAVMLGDIGRMLELDEQLVGKKGRGEGTEREEVERLLRRWRWQNLVRAGCGLVGGVVGLGVFAGFL